jgi:magnesium transporter
MIEAYTLEDGKLVEGSGLRCVEVPEGETRTWFHVTDPTPEERTALAVKLGLHELSIRDALRMKHPAKLAHYDNHLFVIAHTPVQGGESLTRKIAVFLGETWIASISRVPLATIAEAQQRIVAEPERFLCAPERVMHAILDHQMDGFERFVDEMVDRVDAMDCGAAVTTEPECLHNIQRERREVARLLRVVRTQRDVCHTLSRLNHPVLSQQITPYLRDVYDHCLRVHDLLEGVRESLALARDGYLSAVNNRLSDVMRVLTVIATIMMPLSLVAGIFGMNFKDMPLLGDRPGFWLTMGFMFAVALGMLAWFRKRRWI